MVLVSEVREPAGVKSGKALVHVGHLKYRPPSPGVDSDATVQ